MRTIIITLLLSLSVAGCVGQPSYGNFTDRKSHIDQQKIAEDAVDQLVTLYPPAHTRLQIKQPTPDVFGQALTRQLRQHGYALIEFNRRADKSRRQQSDNQALQNNNSHIEPLHYVFDRFVDTELYRVTLFLGSQSLTRAYSKEKGKTVAAGHWVHRK